MKYFATEYTIHFDDTMAYGSHHFLTSFKFQCAARESFLFGERIFDVPKVREALDDIHLFTADAYARNLNPAKLGDRIAILLTLEEWHRASARFCYRVMNSQGDPVSAGFQTLICADARTGRPIPLPDPLWRAMEAMRDIEEPQGAESFRDHVLAGGSKVESLFGSIERQTAIGFLAERYPSPDVIPAATASETNEHFENHGDANAALSVSGEFREAWAFSGQATLDPQLLSERIVAYTQQNPSGRIELEHCVGIASELLAGDASGLLSGSSDASRDAMVNDPELSQVAIHLQNVLGAELRRSQGHVPAILIGHSFGEIAALGFSGCFDLPTGVRVVCERARAIAEHAPPDGGLLVVSTDRSTVVTEAALAGLRQVVAAGRNHEYQTVVSGPIDELKHLQRVLSAMDVDAVAIASPTLFHHPSLRKASLAWLERLRELPLARPTIPIYSPVGRRFLSPDDDLAATLASHLLMPFDFQRGVTDIVKAGATKVVDCGSSGSLARIISKAGPNGLVVSCFSSEHLDQPSNDGLPSPSQHRDQRSTDGLPSPTQHRNQQSNGQATPDAEEKQAAPLVAIVGQGCILPGGASSPRQLHEAVVQERTGIVDQRDFDPNWSEDFYSETLTPDRSTSHLTGRVNDDDISVPPGVEQEVFHGFTRAQRLLCIALAPCLASLAGAHRVLCLVGATADGFEDQDIVSSLRFAGLDPSDPQLDARINTGRSAFREPHDAVQEVFDRIARPGLEVVLIDAACASSLYAVALGMQALESHKTDAVIAGGVFCPGQGNSCLFSQFHGTTSTGCRPFDANADGVVFSEGATFVTLRRLADAEQHGLPIAAVVRGAGLSSDGRSSSANVPQTRGQLLSLTRCYANYGIDRQSIDAIEAHGTSTRVGDATELETLRQFFSGCSPNPIPIHSLKGLLGHAGWAAGTASLIAVCEYMRHGVFPAQATHHEASEALVHASATLTVAKRPTPLPPNKCRIAIDGFGFGGANGHIVLESYVPRDSHRNGSHNKNDGANTLKDELVIVAYRQLKPELSTAGGSRFCRDRVRLSDNHILLPDLADDMDISQTLAILLAEESMAQIPEAGRSLRQETSMVLALSGKTHRGVEATMRVLAQRLRRDLDGLDDSIAAINSAADRARPSGPYTLQCMMPNVAAGRAALQLNLNGPNFVVDSGSNSLEAAMTSASLLLHGGDAGGTKLVIVAAIDANPWRPIAHPLDSSRHAPQDEFAAAFAVTTRQHAEASGMSIIATADALHSKSQQPTDQVARTTAQKVQALVDALDAFTTQASDAEEQKAAKTPKPTTESEFPVHVPVWVEAPQPVATDASTLPGNSAILAIASANEPHVAELAAALKERSPRHLVVVVGSTAREVVSNIDDSKVIAVSLADGASTEAAFSRIDNLNADVVVATQTITSWDLSESLEDVASDNSLCELLFLIAQRHSERLQKGDLKLWGLFINGWNGTVHPSAGAISGLLKAVHREIPRFSGGVICTRGLSLSEGWARAMDESSANHDEQEIVYDGVARITRRLRRALSLTEPIRQLELNANSIVIATGGAKGVTAIMADALLRDYQCTIVLLGRTSLEASGACESLWHQATTVAANLDVAQVEQNFYHRFLNAHPSASPREMKNCFETHRARGEVQQTIEHLSSLGGRVEYMVADVTDREQVSHVVKQIASKYGRIDLLVHGAGIQVSKRLEDRTLAEFRKTYSVKVAGLRNLVDECRIQLGGIVSTHLLTSAYSTFGNDGQHDYGAANETLDRLCGLSSVDDHHRWSSIAWLAWDGIGMTRGSEYHALAKQRGLSGLTASHGQQIFRDVLAGFTHSPNNVPLSVAEHVKYEAKTIPPVANAATGRVIELGLDLAKIDCLRYHKVRGAPTLPGAWILERMVDAGLHLCDDPRWVKTVTVRDAVFSRFVRSLAERKPNIRVVAEETADGIVVWMIGDVLHSNGVVLAKDLVFAQATLCFEHETFDLQSSIESVGPQTGNEDPSHQRVADPYCSGRHSELELSGPFDCVRDIAIGSMGRRARIVPNQAHDEASGVIPALLLDAAWRVGAMHASPNAEELYVPVRIGRMVLPIRLNERSSLDWEIRTTCPRLENGNVHWDRTEVLNEIGLKLVVEDTFATPLK